MAEALTSSTSRLDRLESEREIHNLVHRYAELCDQAYDPDGLAALFTEDAVWSSRSKDGSVDFGSHAGREQIRSFFADASKYLGPMTLHYYFSPRVDLAEDGESASGHGYTMAILDRRPAGAREDSTERERVVLGGSYSQEYRKVGDRWLISRVSAEGVELGTFASL